MQKSYKKVRKYRSELIELRKTGLLLRLASGESIASIARETGRSAEHLYRTLQSPEALDLIRESLAEAEAEIKNRFPELIRTSLNELESHIHSKQLTHKKLQAIKMVLNITTRLTTAESVNCSNCPCQASKGRYHA